MPDIVTKAKEAVIEELDRAEETVLERWKTHVNTVGIVKKGGPGSGFRGHTGLPGVHGGSRPRGSGGGKIQENRVIDSSFDVKAMHMRDHLKKDREWTVPDSGVVSLYHSTNADPKSIVEKGLLVGGNRSVYAHQAPREAGGAGYDYTIEFERNIDEKEAYPADSSMHYARTAYENPHWNTYRTDFDFYGVWISYVDVPPTNIKRVRDDRTGQFIYDRDQGGWLVEKQLEIEKQLPINDADKLKIFELRRSMFFDDSDVLAERLFTGEITIGEWQESFKDILRQYYSSSAAIGKGGWDNMTWADWGRLGPEMQKQYKYLQGFAERISDNRDDISLKYIKARARLYGEGAGLPAALMEAGVVFEHFLPWLPKDGSTECLNRCHCRWVNTIIRTEGQWQFVKSVWKLGEADHCGTCIGREGHVETNRIHERVDVPPIIGGY